MKLAYIKWAEFFRKEFIMLLDKLMQTAIQEKDRRIAVAAAHDDEVIKAVYAAVEKGLGHFTLFGHQTKIDTLVNQYEHLKDSDKIKIVHTESDKDAAVRAVKYVHDGKADVLMKGLLPTSTLLKAVLSPEYGIRGKGLLSHVAVFDIPEYDRLVYITDSGMNIEPDLNQKADIIRNAVKVAHALGNAHPRVALLAAVETINSKMQATSDAAILSKMNERGQITGCIVDGPLALDNAISLEAAQHKNIQSDVAGQADILVVPSIEVGNTLYKSLIFFAKAKVGGMIMGAQAPIVLTSRSDDAESKLNSIVIAMQASKNIN